MTQKRSRTSSTSRSGWALALFGLVLAGALVGAVAVTPTHAAAQAQNNSTTSPASASEGGETQVIAEVDQNLIVTDTGYNASSGMFSVTLKNVAEQADSDVTVTEVISRKQASNGEQFGIKQFSVTDGETVTVKVQADRMNGVAAVMVTTQESLEDGTGAYLKEGDYQEADSRLIKGEPTGGQVRATATFVFGGTALMMFTGAWGYVAKRDEDVSDVDVDPDPWWKRWRK